MKVVTNASNQQAGLSKFSPQDMLQRPPNGQYNSNLSYIASSNSNWNHDGIIMKQKSQDMSSGPASNVKANQFITATPSRPMKIGNKIQSTQSSINVDISERRPFRLSNMPISYTNSTLQLANNPASSEEIQDYIIEISHFQSQHKEEDSKYFDNQFSSTYTKVPQMARRSLVVMSAQKDATIDVQEVSPVTQVAEKAKPEKVLSSQGIFAPVVFGAKRVMGEQELKQLRANIIKKHSKVMAQFVDTSDSKFGQIVLKQMFEYADKDGNGTLDKSEVDDALKDLGFDFLNEKQREQLIKKMDKDGNGVIDFEEFVQETPKALRMNLVLLAKQNGHDLGFLV